LLRAESAQLPGVQPDDVRTERRLLSDHRDNLVAERTRLVNQLHAQMLQIDPSYGEKCGALTRRSGVRYCHDLALLDADGILQTRLLIVRQLADHLLRLWEEVEIIETAIRQRVAVTETPLLQLCGIGTLVAARLIGELGCTPRIHSAAALAALAGIAPVAVSSGGGHGHRLNHGMSHPGVWETTDQWRKTSFGSIRLSDPMPTWEVCSMDDALLATGAQAAPQVAALLHRRLVAFLAPLSTLLDAQIDRRRVCTFVATVTAIIRWRNRAHGLLLSELGGYLLAPEHAPAGTKRLSNLLRSPKWSARLIADWLWQQADQRLAALEATGEDALAVWDESVLAKPERLALEGLCAVRSSKAHRLTHIKPGFFQRPSRPVFVPGMQWIGVLLLGMGGSPCVAAMRWWTSRGEYASDKRAGEETLFARCAAWWGQRVVHVWDRGFAGRRWLRVAFGASARFVLRWPARYKLIDASGRERKAWEIARGKRSWGHRLLWDARRHCQRRTDVLALSVTHPAAGQPLWLVVARRGKGQEPWYQLTSEPVASIDDAWRVVRIYARRWQVETTWRYSKSELAMESPRVSTWERREKLLLMATLASAFLLSLLDPVWEPTRRWLLRHGCHRTGKRSRETPAPLYRIRSALSRLWQEYQASSRSPLFENSG
jgi:hypothetical protein